MHSVIRWFRTPLPLKFWLYAAVAVFVVLLEISVVWTGVEALRSVPHPFPWEAALVFGAYMVVLFVVGAFLVLRAVRAYPRHS